MYKPVETNKLPFFVSKGILLGTYLKYARESENKREIFWGKNKRIKQQ